MRTQKHLERLGGPKRRIGDGPLGAIASRLVAQHSEEEADKLRRAQVRAEIAGQGPIFEVLQRLAAQVAEDDLVNVQAPMIMRFEAQELLKNASRAHPTDRGLKMAKAYAYQLWRQDPTGTLSVGQVAELRDHFMSEFPRSRLSAMINSEFPKVAFNTLPINKLVRIAAEISDQASYDAAVVAYGLDGTHPEQVRARAYIRGLLAMADEQPAREARIDGSAAADRTLHRLAQEEMPMPMDEPMDDTLPPVEDEVPHEESTEEMATVESPITGEELVLELGISDEEEGGEDLPEGAEGLDVIPDDVDGLEVMGQLEDMMGDEEPPLDEDEGSDLPMPGGEETLTTIEDPSSGEMLEVTLTPVEDEPNPIEDSSMISEPAADTALGMEAASKCGKCGMMWKQGADKCAGCGYMKKGRRGRRIKMAYGDAWSEYQAAIDGGYQDSPMAVQGVSPPGWEKTVEHMKEYHTKDGSEIENPFALAWWMHNQGYEPASKSERKQWHKGVRATREGHRVFAAFAIKAGTKADEPLEIFAARSMAHALRHIANYGVRGEVRSNDFENHALVILDSNEGDFIYVQAAEGAEHGDEFDPSINEQQPAQMSISQDDGKKVLMSEEEIGQPRATMDVLGPKESRLSKSAAIQICGKLGIDAGSVEDQILSGRRVTAGYWAIEVDDNDQIVVSRGKTAKKTASLWDVEDAISNFMMGVARERATEHRARKQRENPNGAKQGKTPKTQTKTAQYDLRPLFDLGCRMCGGIDEFLMPDQPVAAKCASCGNVISPDEIGRRLAQLEAFDNFVLTADIPAPKDEDLSLNARRLLAAIRSVVPGATGQIAGKQLQVQIRRASDRQMNRIRKVLEDQFGVRNISSGTADKTAATPVSSPTGTPTQHATMTAPPPQAQQATGGPTYVGPPPAPPPTPQGIEQPMVNPAQPAQTGTGVQQEMMQQATNPKGAGRWVVQARHRGKVIESMVEANDAATAKLLYKRFNRGHEIVRIAQMGAEPPAGPMPDAPGGPEDMGGPGAMDPMGAPPPGLGAEMGAPGLMGGPPQLDDATRDAIIAALTHYRNMGLGVVEALADFQNNYRELMETHGPKEDPGRHMFEGEIIALAGEVYSKPGLMTEASLRTAEESGNEFEPKVNEQQDDYVNLGEGDDVLGPDSETDPSANSALEADSINEQVDTVKDQAGAEGASTEQQSDTETNDPKDYGAYAGDAPKAQHPATDQKGVSLTDKDLGQDSDTGESQGGSTEEWESASDRANALQIQRSKAGTRQFRMPEE